MAVLHIDVVSKVAGGSEDDAAIIQVREQLSSYIEAIDVLDMIHKVVSAVGQRNRLGRLRIFGHGNPGIFSMGQVPSTITIQSMTPSHTNKVVFLARGQMVNGDQLMRLKNCFDARGWAELHACKVAADDAGKNLLKALAKMWNVPVKGGKVLQYAGGGIEGTVVTARPSGDISEKAPPVKPKGFLSF